MGFDASRKLVQYPNRFGDGACFRSEPVDDELSRRLAEMCRGLGFFGMFEAEFIEEDGRKLLIDFNPRLFNGLALPVARGLRLPLLHYLAALGRLDEVEEELAKGERLRESEGVPSAWRQRTVLRALLSGRRASRRLSSEDAQTLRRWISNPPPQTIDAASEADDPWPGRLDGLALAWRSLRDPRYFAGTFLRD